MLRSTVLLHPFDIRGTPSFLLLFAILANSIFAASPVYALPLLQDDPVALCTQGLQYHDAGQDKLALPFLEEGVARYKSADFSDKNVLGNCALVLGLLIYLTRPEDAIQAYAIALDAFRQTGNKREEATTLFNLGVAYETQGHYSEALDLYEQSLQIVSEEERVGKGIILNEMGFIYSVQGHYAEALDHYMRALAIQDNGVDELGEGITLDNIGSLYRLQGRYEDALDYYQQALVAKEKVGDIAGRATTLNNIGLVYEFQGDDALALKNFKNALDLLTNEVNDPINRGAILTNIGDLYLNQKQYREAEDSYQQALSLYNGIGNPSGKAVTLNQIGSIHAVNGRYEEALKYLQQALDISQAAGDQNSSGFSFYNIGYVYQKMMRPDQAVLYYEKAMDVFETVRATTGSETARASFISQYSDLYDLAIKLYYEQNLPEKAFSTSERGRARSFLDSLATGNVQLSDDEATKLYKREQESYAVKQSLQNTLTLAKEEDATNGALITKLESQLALAEADYQDTLNAIAARGDTLAQLVPGRSNVLDVQQAQALLDSETTVLSFWVLDDQTLVFILNQDSLKIIPLKITRSDLFKQIEVFRDFANIETAYPESSVKLYQSIISPLKPYLEKRHLIIIPHSQLHYLPFAALTNGSRYLLDDYVITYLPSISALPFIQQNARETGGQPLIIGNPITGDYSTTASLTTERDQLGPLPFAEQEANSIAKQLGIKSYIEAGATETLVKHFASQTNILHLAAHGLFNRTAPLSSLIALAPDQENDGWLTVGEVYGLDLKNTDIIVLSACETQIGQLTTGDEFVGLARAFFFAGTPTVIASLWKVDDKSTYQLMENFYAHMKEGMGKADAFRQAQEDVRKEFPNPYFWAGFVLSGDSGEIKAPVPFQSESTATPSPSPTRIPGCSGGLAISIFLFVIIGWIRRSYAGS